MQGFGVDFPMSEAINKEQIYDLQGLVLSTVFTPNTHLCNAHRTLISNMVEQYTTMGDWCTIGYLKDGNYKYPAFLPNNGFTFDSYPRIFFYPGLVQNNEISKNYFLGLLQDFHRALISLEGTGWEPQIVLVTSHEVRNCLNRPANPMWNYLI